MSRFNTRTKAFFREQDKRMNVSDDDMEEYYARMVTNRRRSQQHLNTPDNEISETSSSPKTSPRKRKKLQPIPVEAYRNKRIRREEPLTSLEDLNNATDSAIATGGPLTSPASSPSHQPSFTSSRKPQNKARNNESEASRSSQTAQAKSPERNYFPQDSLPVRGSTDAKSTSLRVYQSTVPVISNGIVIDTTVHDDTSSVVSSSSPIEDPSAFLPASASRPSGPVKSDSVLFDDLREAMQAYHQDERSAARQHSAKKGRPKVTRLDTNEKGKSHDDDHSSIISVRSSSPAPADIPVSSGKRVAKTNSKAAIVKGKLALGKKQTILNKKGKKPTPEEYARIVQEQAEELRAKVEHGQFLQGMKIYYFGGDLNVATESTIKKMDLIVKHGADLVDKYDPSVITQMIVEKKPESPVPFLRSLGLRKLDDIPFHIPTLTWNWIQDALTKWSNYRAINKGKSLENFEVKMANYWDFPRFSERINAGGDINAESADKKASSKQNRSTEFSHILDFSIDNIDARQGSGNTNEDNVGKRRPAQKQRSNLRIASSSRVPLDLQPQELPTKSANEDPLAEFYAKAMAQCNNRLGRYGEVEETDDESDLDSDDGQPVVPIKRGWACDSKESRQGTCINQDIIDKLEELKAIHQAKPSADDRWRVLAYSKSIRTLRSHPKRIKSYKDALALHGVGEKTAQKIMEIIQTGNLRRIQHEKTEDLAVLQLFTGIYGVGKNIAIQWYNNGARTLKDLTSGKFKIKLSLAQEIGIRYYDDINSRMPRTEAQAIFKLIKPIALSIDPALFVEIMGSYRRGKADCGDIDILITRNDADGKTHEGVLRRLLKKLHAADILTEDLAVPEENDLESCYRGLCHLPGVESSRRRRIDFLTTTWKSRGAALLYYTGDDLFNRSMRLKANKMGYSLNQRGLWSGVVRNPSKRTEKLERGTIIASETEQDIFKILKVPWQEPHERVRHIDDLKLIANSGEKIEEIEDEIEDG